MQTYKLTINWQLTPSITVIKDFKNLVEASKWQQLCLDICGRNERGETYSSSLLTQV